MNDKKNRKNGAATELAANVGSPTGFHNRTTPNELIFHICHELRRRKKCASASPIFNSTPLNPQGVDM